MEREAFDKAKYIRQYWKTIDSASPAIYGDVRGSAASSVTYQTSSNREDGRILSEEKRLVQDLLIDLQGQGSLVSSMSSQLMTSLQDGRILRQQLYSLRQEAAAQRIPLKACERENVLLQKQNERLLSERNRLRLKVAQKEVEIAELHEGAFRTTKQENTSQKRDLWGVPSLEHQLGFN